MGAIMERSQLTDRTSVRALLVYLAVWAAATVYLAATGGDWVFPIRVAGHLRPDLERCDLVPDAQDECAGGAGRPAKPAKPRLARLSRRLRRAADRHRAGRGKRAIPEGPNQEWRCWPTSC